MLVTREGIKEPGQIETRRSEVKASHVDTNLPRNIARYLDPPKDTCFPLEYAYYLLGDIRGKVVLDLGCGTGGNSRLLARRGALVYGIDISEPSIHTAKQRTAAKGMADSAKFFVGSAHEFPLANNSVDIVFGIAILHHLELPPVTCEVRRVLRDGGRAIFMEPVRNSKLLKRLRALVPYRAPDVSPFERPLTDQELSDFASGYGWYQSKAFQLPYISLAQFLPGLRNHLDPLYRLDRLILERFGWLDYYATVRVIHLIK